MKASWGVMGRGPPSGAPAAAGGCVKPAVKKLGEGEDTAWEKDRVKKSG